MLTKLLIPFRVIINFLWALVTTAMIGVAIIIDGIFKLLLPIAPVQALLSTVANGLFRLWAYAMSMLFQLTQPMSWHIEGDLALHKKGWYMIMANHRSWVDVFVLMHLARRNMPMPRFFLKRQLLWIPIVGWGCWVLDMPFMRRYSEDVIAKKPHLKGRDIELHVAPALSLSTFQQPSLTSARARALHRKTSSKRQRLSLSAAT